jgi:y4mF family transcriptional regulator
MSLKQPGLGAFIKNHRKSTGLSQLKFAQLVGVGKTLVYDLENGKETVQLSYLNKILDGLNIQVELMSPLDKTK